MFNQKELYMMKPENVGFFHMVRAPFLSSILSPIIAGSLIAISISGNFNLWGFILVLIMGVALHVATNVYNDIYDTIQGTDKININRNEFSGGSGVLLDNPDLFPIMYRIARVSLTIALFATFALMLVVQNKFWIYLWVLYLLSAFFSKFYTAAPIKLSYRGYGEFFVWLAFGPMAILVASVSQNVGLQPTIIIIMPVTGLSTLSILLIGEMIDMPADKAAGKMGIAARFGTAITSYIYLIVQLLIILDILLLSFGFLDSGYPIILCLIPYVIFLPGILKTLSNSYDNPVALKPAAKVNVKLHLSFSVLLIIGLLIHLAIIMG